MIRDLEGKTAKELREIVSIQVEEYRKLAAENTKLRRRLALAESYMSDTEYSHYLDKEQGE